MTTGIKSFQFQDHVLPFLLFSSLLAVGGKYMFGNVEPSGLGDAINEPCKALGTSPFKLAYTGINEVDTGICILVSFFHETISDPLPKQQLIYYLSTGLIMGIFIGMESSRNHRGASITSLVAWLLMGQVISMAGVMPLYCLLFVFKKAYRQRTRISQTQAESIIASLVIGGGISTIAMINLPNTATIVVWQLYPVCMALAELIRRFIRPSLPTSKASDSGHKIIQVLLLAHLVGSALYHMTIVWSFKGDLELLKLFFIPSLAPVDPAERMGLKVLELLKWDYAIGVVAIMAATLWFASSARQVLGLLAFYVFGSPILGPGAATTAVVFWRETGL
ncbi:hypothetical protein FA15DRAFT_655430 [Coprinopsis marcescibilis]|uniref:Uncharacterized protein n=1 Tax=Coprinopsis marcescibilis TaxID=230819 RepID=A0A5C3L9W9_COPMA|nr:hypothetical protein FA15DRAFT_655430 [Coprinopsis marcescibilis]